MFSDIADLHTHTIMSGHAYNTLYEMVRSASEKGLKLLGSTEHAPRIPGSCNPFYFLNFSVIPRTLYGVRLLMGCELNIVDYDGNVDLSQKYLNRLDFSIASIHEPCFACGTASQNTGAYLGALKNPYIHIIGHPDDSRFPVDYDTLVAAAKEHHKLLEINASSLHPRTHRVNAHDNYLTMLEFCRRYSQPVIINSDAHCEADVGNHRLALELLKEIDFPGELVLNSSMERIAEYIPSLRGYLDVEEPER